MRKWIFLSLLATVACNKGAEENDAMARRAISGLLQCRDQFTTAVKTIGTTAASLDADQRYRMMSSAVLQRQQCEDLPIRQSNAFLTNQQ